MTAVRDSELARGWRLLLAAFLGIGLGLAVLPAFTVGLFAPHLRQAFGWSMGQIMAGHMIMTVGIWLVVPVAGVLADRYGVRRVALLSLAAYAAVFMAFALTTRSILLFYATYLLLAVVGTGSLPPVWTRAVNAAFDRQKGLALGLAAMGTGLFGSLLKPVTSALIAALGWRGAYVAVGCIPLLVAWPVAYACFRQPAPRPEEAAVAGAPVAGLTVREALADRRFWILAIAFPLASFGVIGPIPNAEAILRSVAVPEARIVGITGALGLATVAGRVLGGMLVDRIWAPLVAFAVIACPAAACVILAQDTVSVPLAFAAMVLIGFGVGAELDLVGFLVARYFGLANYATLFGIFYGLCFLAGGVGPWAFGHGFDRAGSYAPMLQVAAAVLLAAAASFLLLGRYRYPSPGAGRRATVARDARLAGEMP